jgi:hypothetical protein
MMARRRQRPSPAHGAKAFRNVYNPSKPAVRKGSRSRPGADAYSTPIAMETTS